MPDYIMRAVIILYCGFDGFSFGIKEEDKKRYLKLKKPSMLKVKFHSVTVNLIIHKDKL